MSVFEALAQPQAVSEDDATTTALLDAALRQFEMFGLARSTIADISRRAGVARVTVYRRFGDKEGLVEAVILRELRRFLTDLAAAVESLGNPEERMVEGFVFTLDAVRSHALLQRLLETEPEMLLPHLTTQGAPFIAAAREFLAAEMSRNVEAGATPDDELRTLAEVVVRLLLSFVLTPQFTSDLDDPSSARAFAGRYLRPLMALDERPAGDGEESVG